MKPFSIIAPGESASSTHFHQCPLTGLQECNQKRGHLTAIAALHFIRRPQYSIPSADEYFL